VQPGSGAGRSPLHARRDDLDQRWAPAPIEDVARSFIEAFPDIQVLMDDLVFADEAVEYRWTFTGTSSETGKWVRVSGAENVDDRRARTDRRVEGRLRRGGVRAPAGGGRSSLRSARGETRTPTALRPPDPKVARTTHGSRLHGSFCVV